MNSVVYRLFAFESLGGIHVDALKVVLRLEGAR